MAFAVAPLPVATPLRPPDALAGWRRRPGATPARFTVVLATSGGVGSERAPPTFGRLREELLQLHAEADLTQSKANSARVRLVRLTEAAENLKKRAAISVRMGKENEAVDLLVQKKKLTKALENIKERIEVLDRLSAKINEAISMKQTMLIEYALRPGTSNGESPDDKIRVFSSTVNEVNGTESSDSRPKSGEKESFVLRNKAHASMADHPEQSAVQTADGFTFLNDPDTANSIKNHSTYDEFLEHIDSQMKSLECEIEQFISCQSIEEVGSDVQRNKWKRLSDIQMLVKETRERIARIWDMTIKETEFGDSSC